MIWLTTVPPLLDLLSDMKHSSHDAVCVCVCLCVASVYAVHAFSDSPLNNSGTAMHVYYVPSMLYDLRGAYCVTKSGRVYLP